MLGRAQKKLNGSFSVCLQTAEKGALGFPSCQPINITDVGPWLLGVAQTARKWLTMTEEEEEGEFSETHWFGIMS